MQTLNTVSFPGLGLEFTFDRVAFSIGSLPIYWYGILIALGFMMAILYTTSRAKEFGVDPDRMLDVIIGGSIAGIIGARAYYVLFRWDYYGQNLDQIFNTRSGGLGIYGGIIVGVLFGVLMCKWRKVKVLPALDLAAGGFLIGQCIGRWGNFVNVEAFGGNTSLPWGMSSPTITAYLAAHEAELEAIGMTIDPNMPVHPTFLYESLWCLLGFGLIAWYTKHRRYDGELILLYMIWYGCGRTFIEGRRTDSLMIPGTDLRASQVVATVLCTVAFVIHMYNSFKTKKTGIHLFADTEEGKLIAAGEYYNKKSDPSAEKTEEIKAADENTQEISQENFPGNISETENTESTEEEKSSDK